MLIFGTRKIPWDFKWPGPPPHTHTHTHTPTPPSFPCILSVFITFPITQRLIHPNHFIFLPKKKCVFLCLTPLSRWVENTNTALKWDIVCCQKFNHSRLGRRWYWEHNFFCFCLSSSLAFKRVIDFWLPCRNPSLSFTSFLDAGAEQLMDPNLPPPWFYPIGCRHLIASSPHHPRFNPQCWSRVKKGDWNVWSVWD